MNPTTAAGHPDTDRLKALAAYVYNTADQLDAMVGTVVNGSIAEGWDAPTVAEVWGDERREAARTDRDALSHVLGIIDHLKEAAECAVSHLADADYRKRCSDPTADAVNPSDLLYGDGTPVTTAVFGTAIVKAWQDGLSDGDGTCGACTLIMTPHDAAPPASLAPMWTTVNPDCRPEFDPKTGDLIPGSLDAPRD